MSRGGYGRQAQEFASDLRLRAKRLVLGRIGVLRQRVPAQEVCNDRARSFEGLFGSSSEQQKTELEDIG